MDVRDKKVTLVGMGKTSVALARLLNDLGAKPFVTECKSMIECSEYVKKFESDSVPFECGGHTEAALRDSCLVIPSPGVPPSIPMIQDALEMEIPVLSELEFASRFNRAKLIAVTGTNGKTTTTELVVHLFRTCGMDAVLAGNNDRPYSSVVNQESSPDYVILEISSYQLELVDEFRPDVAVVLNVTNDHLVRHGTMAQYAATKARIFSRQESEDVAIVNADDPLVAEMIDNSSARIIRFGMSPERDVRLDGDGFLVDGVLVASREDSPLPGQHNTENILAALSVMSVVGADWTRVREGLRSFSGVKHRIEEVTKQDGVTYYNDSKSTNLDSLKVALESFDGSILLIAGGEGKGGDYSVLSELIKERVKQVIAIGADAEAICDAWGTAVPTCVAGSMESAVAMAHDSAASGDVVLLSPACASFDMYTNFEERGADFKYCVNAICGSEVSR